jgi:hypothetical protein
MFVCHIPQGSQVRDSRCLGRFRKGFAVNFANDNWPHSGLIVLIFEIFQNDLKQILNDKLFHLQKSH